MTEKNNLDYEREITLEKIKNDVKKAYDCRRFVSINQEAKADEETIREKRQKKQSLRELSDNAVVYADGTLEPWQAEVTNSHDFGILIASALHILIENEVFSKEEYPPEKIQLVVEAYLKHEYEHHVPGLGYDGLSVTYCVEFLEDLDKGLIGFRPLIKLQGELTLGLYKDIVTAPEHLSGLDKVYDSET
jgi:actin-related protein